jgi:hypothetical protein
MTPIPTPASGGTEAIHAAGVAVNRQRLESTESIRRAIPIARQAAAAAKSLSESTGWRVGRYTGLPIAIYQNWLYEMNRDWRFTDGTLCVLWCIEFPDARSDYPDKWHYIASTRGEYNRGRHQAPAPSVPCVGYDITGKSVSTPPAKPLAEIGQPSRPPASAVLTPVRPLRPRTFNRSSTSVATVPRRPDELRISMRTWSAMCWAQVDSAAWTTALAPVPTLVRSSKASCTTSAHTTT